MPFCKTRSLAPHAKWYSATMQLTQSQFAKRKRPDDVDSDAMVAYSGLWLFYEYHFVFLNMLEESCPAAWLAPGEPVSELTRRISVCTRLGHRSHAIFCWHREKKHFSAFSMKFILNRRDAFTSHIVNLAHWYDYVGFCMFCHCNVYGFQSDMCGPRLKDSSRVWGDMLNILCMAQLPYRLKAFAPIGMQFTYHLERDMLRENFAYSYDDRTLTDQQYEEINRRWNEKWDEHAVHQTDSEAQTG